MIHYHFGSTLQKPKKAASAYFLFPSEVREQVMKAHKERNDGKLKLGDIAKKNTADWVALPEADKKKCEEKGR